MVDCLFTGESRDDVDHQRGGVRAELHEADADHQAVHQGGEAVQGDSQLQLDVRNHFRTWTRFSVKT